MSDKGEASPAPKDATAAEAAGSGDAESGEAARAVAAYLRAHPDFLAEHPDLLAALVPEQHKREDGTLDLQAYLIQRQREQIQALQAEREELVALHRDNLASQSRIHDVVLKLINAASFQELVQICTGDMTVLMDLDAAVLGVADPEDGVARTTAGGLRLIPSGAIEELLGEHNVALLDDKAGHPAIFGQAAGIVRSAALVRLEAGDGADGLLAFGAREPGQFQPGQGTELLSFLARALEAAIRTQLERGG